MTRLWHDPYCELDRFPLGAVPAGSVVRLCLRSMGPCYRAFVRLWRGIDAEWIEMRPLASGGYEAEIKAGRDPGLLWYFFVADTPEGRKFVGKPEKGVCETCDGEPPSFQITVYGSEFETPGFLHRGVMMQIMVDRFRVGGEARKPHGRGAYLHKSWDEAPDLRRGGKDDDLESVDFFGGNLKGVEEKLDYIASLGVSVLYFNPIFRARSNHKYDTGDYMQIDPSFGTEADFRRLAEKAGKMGIRVILDGVFSHTGADSRYFNRYHTYDSVGAYESERSPYAKWYDFGASRDDYDSWWGIKTLPNVIETEPGYLNYIVRNDDSVVSHWLRAGASGWRLDVADELPMDFIRALRARVKSENPQNAVIGEVWEDVTNKISYGRPRSYALGDTLDSAMNYPLREHLISFLRGEIEADELADFLNHQLSTLPPPILCAMMNLLGSHDKPRVINVLSGQENLEPPHNERAFVPLTREQYALGSERFARAFEFVCHWPGMPCLYYGDEAGLTGMGDPFCRAPYPWGHEDKALAARVRAAIFKRNSHPVLQTGFTRVRALNRDALEVTREISNGRDALGNPAADAKETFVLRRI